MSLELVAAGGGERTYDRRADKVEQMVAILRDFLQKL